MRPYNLTKATFIDVNTRLTMNEMPELIPDIESVKWCALFNLFRCPVGGRGRIFNARFGSNLYYILQEPIDEATANSLNLALFDAIRTWEPRVTVNFLKSSITPNYNLPGYNCILSLIDNITGRSAEVAFDLKAK